MPPNAPIAVARGISRKVSDVDLLARAKTAGLGISAISEAWFSARAVRAGVGEALDDCEAAGCGLKGPTTVVEAKAGGAGFLVTGMAEGRVDERGDRSQEDLPGHIVWCLVTVTVR